VLWRGVEQVLREQAGKSIRDQSAYDYVVDHALPPGAV
jgi:hypothetical protein